MTKIRKFFISLIVTCLFFVAASFFAVKAQAAARIYFEPASPTVVIGNDVQINVKIDTDSQSIFGADALINYTGSDFTVKSVNYGGFFSDTVTPVQNSSQIIIRGSFFSSVTGLGSGSGTFATITLTALKAAGTSTLSFVCGNNSTDIIDGNGNNILSCSSLNQASITFSAGSTTGTPTPTPQPGTTAGSTNACGGTCGSVYNCNVNLFCYQGFCRNPDCPNSSTCGCPTATPTPKKTVKPTIKPTSKATPLVVVLSTITPSPIAIPRESPVAAPQGGSSISPILVYAILGVIAIIVIVIAIRALRRKSPPKFTPPTNIPPVVPPPMPPTGYP